MDTETASSEQPACAPGAPAVAALTAQERTAVWFPEARPGTSNHGLEAIRICTGCPIRETCLREAVARGEPAGIWGGAGQSRRRVLRRAFVAGRYDRVAAAHFRTLDNVEHPTDRYLLQAFGEGATHGRRVTYARGCDCEPCTLSASFETVSKGGTAA